MKIGYARISTHEQTLDLQHDALKEVGCQRILTDTVSGASTERPGLSEVLSFLREGDTLVVWRLDRLGRSLRHLIDIVRSLEERHVGFESLTEHIDTNTPSGKLVFHIFGALAEFERDLIRERTHAGLSAARARGRRGGRPKAAGLDSPKKVVLARTLYNSKETSIGEICRTLRVSRATLYRYLKQGGAGEAIHP